ncbi:MAG: TadE family protein [Actinomycetota bacterium]
MRAGRLCRRASAGVAADSGSALVEFTLLTMVLIVPLLYLVFTLGRIQAGMYAAQGAAREAGRVFVTTPDEARAHQQALTAAHVALQDQGFTSAELVELNVSCPAGHCRRPDSKIPIRVVVEVVFPGVPRGLSAVVPARLEVQAEHVATVDRFRSPS